jgi:hypothetical protein
MRALVTTHDPKQPEQTTQEKETDDVICIHEDILTQLGMNPEKIRALAAEFMAHGILPSAVGGFADVQGPRPRGLPQVDWLAGEPAPQLLLVGVDDRHGEGARIAGRANVRIVHASNGRPTRLTQDDRVHLPDLLRPYGWSAIDRVLLRFFILTLFEAR